MTVGSVIRQLREDRGWSQFALTDAINKRTTAKWHKNTLSKVETGQRGLGFEEASVVADVLGVTLDELRDGSPDRERAAAHAALAEWHRVLAGHIEVLAAHAQRLPAVRSRAGDAPWHPDMALLIATGESALETIALIHEGYTVVGFAGPEGKPVVTDGER